MGNNYLEYTKKVKQKANIYLAKFLEYSFDQDLTCYSSEKSYEGSIRRWTHIVQKGLSMNEYKYGSGRRAFDILLELLINYSKEYEIDCVYYQDALNALEEYLKKNKQVYSDYLEIREKVDTLPGIRINKAAVINYKPKDEAEYGNMTFEEIVKDRHSIRHFSNEKLSIDDIVDAAKMADYSPSACNRKGWTTYFITNKQKIMEVLKNQNGNRGFGEEIQVLGLVTFDLHFCNIDRELFQAFIDGGMYSMNLINSLHSKGIATIPLSASLYDEQEDAIRNILGISDAEVFILFIGMGNYAETNLVTKYSERNSIKIYED